LGVLEHCCKMGSGGLSDGTAVADGVVEEAAICIMKGKEHN